MRWSKAALTCRGAASGQPISRVVEAEIDERQRAVAEYQGHGLDTADLELELATLKRYGQGR